MLAAGFFSEEVRRLIIVEQLMLDTVERSIECTGTWGAEFMAHRLLYTQLPVMARWDMVRHIAARLAHEDENSEETYPVYVKKLCVRAGQDGGPYLAAVCGAGPDSYSARDCGGLYCEYDLVAAAAYLNKLSVIDEVANRDHNLHVALGIFGNPYMCAALGENLEAVQLLFHKLELHSRIRSPRSVRQALFTRVSSDCSTPMMLLFMPKWSPEYFEDLDEDKRSPAMNTLDRALSTSNMETFDTLMRIKETTPYPELDEEHLTSLLNDACQEGSEEMVRRLLALGASLEGYDYEYDKLEDPLKVACSDSFGKGTMNLQRIASALLSHGAQIKGDEIAIAAKTGNLGLVQTLVQAGVDVNTGAPKPLVSAVGLERTDLFEALVGWGARIDGEVGKACAERARLEGLESMLSLLEQHRVNIASIVKESNSERV